MKKIKNIAIIPARIGSQRIKEKNIKLFFNKPIIYWTIKILKNSGLFQKIYVSTDSNKIIKILKKIGFNNFILRNKSLSNNFIGTTPVIIDAIKKISLNFNFDNVCCVYPCSPFLKRSFFIEAFDKLKKNKKSLIFPVIKYSHPIQRAFIFKKKSLLQNISLKKIINKRTQDFKDSFYDSGTFYLADKKTWLKKSNLKKIGIKINWWDAVDIDNSDDWKKAELIFKLKKKIKIRN